MLSRPRGMTTLSWLVLMNLFGWLLVAESRGAGVIMVGLNCGTTPCNNGLIGWGDPTSVCNPLLPVQCCFPSQVGWWGDRNNDGIWDISICCPADCDEGVPTAVWTDTAKTDLTCDCLKPCDPSGLDPC